MLAINIQDVINVLSSVKTHLIVQGVALVVALAVIIACKALPVAKKKLVCSSALVALGLAVIIVVNTICFGPMFTMINLAMGGGSITEESMAEAYEVNTELVSEGVTLGMVLTDYFGVYGYMDADQAIRNGTDFCLVNYPTETNYLTGTTSATGVLAARQAVKNILYTVVNSRAYMEENLNPGLPTWQLIGYGIDAVLVLALAALEIKAVKNYKRRVSEQPVATVAEGEGAAE